MLNNTIRGAVLVLSYVSPPFGSESRSLVKAGIGFGRLGAVTRGEMKPKVPNKDARGMALNCRVVFSAL